MMSKESWLLYTGAIFFIGIWWAAAFQSDEKPCFTLASSYPISMDKFHPIDRDQLKNALIGDTSAMMELIALWDHEGRECSGLRLSAEEYRLAHQLSLEAKSDSDQRFFPQTYAAATFMLALAPANQIVALPRGLREQTDLFPEAITKQITYDTDRYNTELLSINKPAAAFISAYSDPNTLNALKQQQIPGFILNDGNTVNDIISALQEVGEITGNHEKAKLLSLFMKAAFHALDNRTNWLHSSGQMPRFLCALQVDSLKLPTKHTITGQILTRMGIETSDEMSWSIPLTKEHIQQVKPDFIIVATDQKNYLNYRTIPYRVQMFPTQHVVLAYYDILQALLS